MSERKWFIELAGQAACSSEVCSAYLSMQLSHKDGWRLPKSQE